MNQNQRTRFCAFTGSVLLFLAISLQAGAEEFHVSPSGNDANSGSRSKPFASLERARDAVRDLRRKHAEPGGTITVWLHGGDYVRTKPLELTSADTADYKSPVVWRSYRNQPVRLLGGRVLKDFTTVTSPEILARFDPPARTHVVQLDLRALGITDFGEMKSRGFGRPTATAHCELFYDHRPMTLARWPNEGEFAKIAGYPTEQKDEHGANLGPLNNGFTYSGDRPGRWQDPSDLWAHGYWAYDWANSYEKVASLDLAQRLVKTEPPQGHYGFRKDQRIYFLNVLEELDQPGEWFLDRKNGMLYFWPPSSPKSARDRKKNSPEILLSLLDQPLVRLTDVSHVTFRGITLEGTRGNAVEISGGASNLIAGCLIRNIGNNGVVINDGHGHGVAGCDIIDTGDGGVFMTGGDRQTLTPGGHFVENSHFQRQGRWSKCYVPAVSMTGVGLRASNNLIHDHPHCAILFWGNDHVMEFNEIHHIALETGDVGAIYTGRDYTFRGNKIRHNFIHHTGGVGMGSMGVYMDDCVSGTEVFGNIFHKVHWAMFIGGGRDHQVKNNLFVDCDPAIRMDGRGVDTTPVWRNMVDDFMRKRLTDVPLALYRERYPEMKSLDAYYGTADAPITGEAFKGVPPEGNVVAHNICVGKWIETGWHAKNEDLKLQGNATDAGAGLIKAISENSPVTDFGVQNSSPPWAAGYERIPVEKIGLRDDEFRRALKKRTLD